ncbi:hypothetical protein ACRAWG_15780 [Methylobacterium sp. P31]
MPNFDATIDIVGQGRICADPQNEPAPTMAYVRQLRNECREYRLKLAAAEQTIASVRGRSKSDARRKISSVLAGQPVRVGEAK